MNVVQCYGPTDEKTEEAKDDFYELLHDRLSCLIDKDITILTGDMNANIGPDNTGYVEVVGTHGLGEVNENGQVCRDMGFQQHGHWWQHLPTNGHPQSNMGVPRPHD